MLAEFLLRKTQTFRVLPVFLKLIQSYPNFEALAEADPTEVCAIIGPLGLSTRGSQLSDIARALRSNKAIIESGQSLRKFKGVGQYIANAVDCVAFERPFPMVDGAVGRLLCRILGRREGRRAYSDKSLWSLVSNILQSSPENSKHVSLGLLDIAAAYCRLKKPLCIDCPLASLCKYKQQT